MWTSWRRTIRIVAAAPGGGTWPFEGTSFAVPFVAATAALTRAGIRAWARPTWCTACSRPPTRRPGLAPVLEYGYGVLNPARALTEVSSRRSLAPRAPPHLPAAAGRQPAVPAPAVSTTLARGLGV